MDQLIDSGKMISAKNKLQETVSFPSWEQPTNQIGENKSVETCNVKKYYSPTNKILNTFYTLVFVLLNLLDFLLERERERERERVIWFATSMKKKCSISMIKDM